MPHQNASRSRSRSLTTRNGQTESLNRAVLNDISISTPSTTHASSASQLVSQSQDLISMQLFLHSAIQETQTRFPSAYSRPRHVVRHNGHPGTTWLHPISWDQSSPMTQSEQVAEVARWTPANINPFFIEPSYLSCIAGMVCSPSVALIWNDRLEAWTLTAAASRENNCVYKLEYRFERNQWYPRLIVV